MGKGVKCFPFVVLFAINQVLGYLQRESMGVIIHGQMWLNLPSFAKEIVRLYIWQFGPAVINFFKFHSVCLSSRTKLDLFHMH